VQSTPYVVRYRERQRLVTSSQGNTTPYVVAYKAGLNCAKIFGARGRHGVGCGRVGDMSEEFADELSEFVTAQDTVYDQVRHELATGRKRTHWIWYIFPQMAGLGTSPMSQRFGIQSRAEARAYLDHPVLGQRLREFTRLVLAVKHDDIDRVMGYPDDLKFRSCMTLFAAVAPEEPVFKTALDKFFNGEPDEKTLRLIEESKS